MHTEQEITELNIYRSSNFYHSRLYYSALLLLPKTILLLLLALFVVPGPAMENSANMNSMEDLSLRANPWEMPTEKVKLTARILRKNKWQEVAPIPNCIVYKEFNKGGRGRGYGCGLVGVIDFNYIVEKDTLYTEQFRVFGNEDTPKKWMGGKYIYTGHSIVLVSATEWDATGKATDVYIARKHEYQRGKEID